MYRGGDNSLAEQEGNKLQGQKIFIFIYPIYNQLMYLLTAIEVVTRWQQYSTHLHANNTQNDTKQTIHRTTLQFGSVRAVSRLG